MSPNIHVLKMDPIVAMLEGRTSVEVCRPQRGFASICISATRGSEVCVFFEADGNTWNLNLSESTNLRKQIPVCPS